MDSEKKNRLDCIPYLEEDGELVKACYQIRLIHDNTIKGVLTVSNVLRTDKIEAINDLDYLKETIKKLLSDEFNKEDMEFFEYDLSKK